MNQRPDIRKAAIGISDDELKMLRELPTWTEYHFIVMPGEMRTIDQDEAVKMLNLLGDKANADGKFDTGTKILGISRRLAVAGTIATPDEMRTLDSPATLARKAKEFDRLWPLLKEWTSGSPAAETALSDAVHEILRRDTSWNT